MQAKGTATLSSSVQQVLGHRRETILTVRADEHPLIRRFRRPGKEKRMAVILVCASSPQRVLALRRHSGTAAVAPARSGYPRRAGRVAHRRT